MSKLLNLSLKRLLIYAGIVLVASIPVYYAAMSRLWEYEMDEHQVVLTEAARREDKLLIVGAVTSLTVVFVILMLTGFILINRRIAQRLWKPFYKSLHQITQFDLDQHTAIEFEQTNIEEFAVLNNSLNKLIQGNIAAYTQQKEFADNASHELQTPLAIVQSKLELLAQSQSLTNEQYQMIEEAQYAVSRVNRINKNLLLLSKIGNSQFMDRERINLSVLLDISIRQLSSFLNDKRLTTTIDPGIYVEGNKILIEILLNNLITNAIRHSPPKGLIDIYLSQHILVISNDGGAALQSEQLFKRFATASSQSPGTGLGLALVKQVCNRYNWHIAYVFENGRHVFKLTM